MKAVRQILKWSLITIIAFTTFNGFISGKIESSIEINAPIEQVYFKVIDLKSWSTWAVWWQRDSTMTTKYNGDVPGKGSKISWKSREGNGSLEILDCLYPESIYNKLSFAGMPSYYGVWSFEEIESGTKVTWEFRDELPFFIHFMQLLISPDLKEGLEGLKEVCEYKNLVEKFNKISF
jgi:uncharacterized protein YndB with AHSA1/START domain